MTAVLIQARIGSSRLKAKALLPLADRTLTEHAMLALREVTADLFAIVTDPQSAEALWPPAERCGYQLFCGDPHNVLKRYVDAARHYGVDTIIRGTGDNPVVSGALAQGLLQEHLARCSDLSGYDELPLGCGVEVVQLRALERALDESSDPYELEHVTPYLYRHRDSFDVWRGPAPLPYCAPQVRVTVDTEDDYRRMCALFADRYRGRPIETSEVIEWWRRSVARRETVG